MSRSSYQLFDSKDEIRLNVISKEMVEEIELKSCIEMLTKAYQKQQKVVWATRTLIFVGCLAALYYCANNVSAIVSARAEHDSILDKFHSTKIPGSEYACVVEDNSSYIWAGYADMRDGNCIQYLCNDFQDFPVRGWQQACCKLVSEFCDVLTRVSTGGKLAGFAIGVASAGLIILSEMINIILTEIKTVFSAPRVLFIPITKKYLSQQQIDHAHLVAAKHKIIFLENDFKATLANFNAAYQKLAVPLAFLGARHSAASPLYRLFNEGAKPVARQIFELAGLTAEKEKQRKQKRIAFLAGSTGKNHAASNHGFFVALRTKGKTDKPIYQNSDDMLAEIFDFAGVQKKLVS